MFINMDPSLELIGYLVRHGELTNMKVWDSWSGLELSEDGRRQAEMAAQWLSFERIGRVVSSDLPRAVHTAQYLLDTGCTACQYLETDPNLRPWMVADFTGKEKTPERIAEFQKYILDPSLVIPGGESRDQLKLRAQVVFVYLSTPYKGLPTAIFLHNSVMKAIMDIEEVKDACLPGGIIGAFMDPKGAISFQVLLGETDDAKGVS